MRSALLLLFLIAGLSLPAQTDTTDDTGDAGGEAIANASLQAKSIMIDMSNPADVDMALKRIYQFKNLESVTLDGPADEGEMDKILYRLSVQKNVTALTLRNNDITSIPDNLKTLKSLRSLSVEGNTGLDYTALCNRISALPLNELHLRDNDLKKDPPPFGAIKSLKKIEISGNEQLDYESLVDELANLPGLTALQLPVNYITQLPTNITKLKSLQVLDVSNNVLTEMPQEVSALKAINNLSIQGNLLMNPVKDLEKFKGNDIRFLSLDKELSNDETDQIKKMFPNAKISFPEEEKDDADALAQATPTPAKPSPVKEKQHSGELRVKKETAILSMAYLGYPALFQGLSYVFDTTTMEERYLDLKYTNVYQRALNVSPVPASGSLYLRKSCLSYERPGKKSEKWFRIPVNDQLVAANYPELRAFSGMYWVYTGELSKKQFRKKFLQYRSRYDIEIMAYGLFKRKVPIVWNDIRIEYDKNNSLFTIKLKGDTGFVQFNAYPVLYGVALEKSQQSYNRRFVLYQKNLQRRSQTFKRQQLRERNRYDMNYNRLQDYAWKELQLRMSDEEKAMSREDWLDYYDNIVANELQAISNASLARAYLLRALELKSYTATNLSINNLRSSTNPNLKTVSVDFIDATGLGKLAVANIIVLDNKEKFYYQQQGTLGADAEYDDIAAIFFHDHHRGIAQRRFRRG